MEETQDTDVPMEPAFEEESCQDDIYRYDAEEQNKIASSKPWTNDPNYFKKCRVSALALLKMTMHARSGGNMEVMGLLIGKIQDDNMIVMDAFALPVQGTETRVNAQAASYEYMSQYMDNIKKVGRLENAIGWYHSHPGYGCWLSGIDVNTQILNQQYQEPWVAIVIDPTRTVSSGKVNIGAFRTYPKGTKLNDEPSEYQNIPLSKIEDFGVHCKQYYSLEIEYFKSSLDKKLLDFLWNKYWINTLSTSSLLSNADYNVWQTLDMADKLEQITSFVGNHHHVSNEIGTKQSERLFKISKDCTKNVCESIQGVISSMIKNQVFNSIM